MLHLDHCSRGANGVNRRNFLKVGSLSLGGLTLDGLLRSQAFAAPDKKTARAKSVVMIYLHGGPSHLDMYDMKPQAPIEYRGEFHPIQTNVPGMEICELMPMQAQIADKFTILRAAQCVNLHAGNMFYSGFPWQENPRVSVPGEARRPAIGSIVSKLRPGPKDVPTYVSMDNGVDWERAYYLGVEHEPVRVGRYSTPESINNMARHPAITPVRLEDRNDLLQRLESSRRELELGAVARGIDRFQQRAIDIISSTKVKDAFDLEQESKETRLRYGDGPFRHGPHPGRSLLLARRLLEAGVSVVTVGVHGWDTHSNNFPYLKDMLPVLDRALHAFVSDLSSSGLLDEVTFVMGGEFGRTPRIGDLTPDGRSHWVDAGFMWIGGGGLRTGQIIGQTDDKGEKVIGNPIGWKSVVATLYKQLGIDPTTTIPDHNGRPQFVLDEREPLAALL